MAVPKAAVALRHVKSVVVRFCPFQTNVETTRIFLEHVNSKKARASNINCVVTTDVRHDGSEPVVDIMFDVESTPLGLVYTTQLGRRKAAYTDLIMSVSTLQPSSCQCKALSTIPH
ncbi:large ribosomal subunit protein mL53 isoform X1 [Eretmochelys imbricata]